MAGSQKARVVGQVAVFRLAHERRHLARECRDRGGAILVPGETGKSRSASISTSGVAGVAGGPTGRSASTRPGPASRSRRIRSPTALSSTTSTSAATASSSPTRSTPAGRHAAAEAWQAARSSRRSFLPLTGDFQLQPGFNLNGIAANVALAVTVQSGTGFLFRLTPRPAIRSGSIQAAISSRTVTGSISVVGRSTPCGTCSTQSPCCACPRACGRPR